MRYWLSLFAFLLAFLLAAGSSATARASAPARAPAPSVASCSALWAKIERIYANSYACDYVDGACYNNALVLARKLLAEPGIDPKKLEVGYIFPSTKTRRSIYARGGRDGSQEWRYHVFVVYDGRVMDHDHGPTASIKTVARYVEDMFEKDIPDSAMIEGQHLFEPRSDALLRMIPARDYVEQTARSGAGTLDYQRYINDPQGNYPAMQLRDFLRRHGYERE